MDMPNNAFLDFVNKSYDLGLKHGKENALVDMRIWVERKRRECLTGSDNILNNRGEMKVYFEIIEKLNSLLVDMRPDFGYME